MSGLDDFIWDELQPKLRELGRLSEGVDAAAGELRAYIIRRLQLGIAESDVARRWLSLVPMCCSQTTMPKSAKSSAGRLHT